jgi:hypothetical protein
LVLVVVATQLFLAKEATATIPFFQLLLQQAAVAVLGRAWETEIAVDQVVVVRTAPMEALELRAKVSLEETIKAEVAAQARQETQTERGKVETVLRRLLLGHLSLEAVVERLQVGRVVTEAVVIKERLEPLIQEVVAVGILLALLPLAVQAALA